MIMIFPVLPAETEHEISLQRYDYVVETIGRSVQNDVCILKSLVLLHLQFSS